MTKAKIPIILLSAGAGSRMGRIKPLLDWHGTPLIVSRINELQKTNQPIITVLGAYHKKIIPYLSNIPVSFVVNKDWKSGMGSSIISGLEVVKQRVSNFDGFMICTVDQPFINASFLSELLNSFIPGQKQIIASQSNQEWIGVPAILDKTYFNEMQNLTGENGAKKIIKSHEKHLLKINGGDLLMDMDTPEAYEQFTKISPQSGS